MLKYMSEFADQFLEYNNRRRNVGKRFYRIIHRKNSNTDIFMLRLKLILEDNTNSVTDLEYVPLDLR